MEDETQKHAVSKPDESKAQAGDGGMVRAALIGVLAGVCAALVGGYFQLQAQRLGIQQAERQSKQKRKEQSVAELLGPVNMQLERTKRAFDRWTAKNVYLETKIIREGNLKVRDSLLEKGHLIPPELLADAAQLVEHYDRWLEEYEKKRGASEPKLDEPFVFVGPEGYPFPSDAAQRFKDWFRTYWNELYGEGRNDDG